MNDHKTSLPGQPFTPEDQCENNPTYRILVVDDDILIRQLSEEVLVRSGYEVDAAEDGAAAWHALNTDEYDLLITDHKMPELTGVELLKRVRAARMALPVIMATGDPPKEEFVQYPWLRPAATLLKPFTGDQLLGTVEQVLRATDGDQGEHSPAPRSQPPTDRSLF
jgi:DNA-binding response OmpR family regulator